MSIPEMSQERLELAEAVFTEMELRRRHRRYGHPSVRRLHTLLKKSGLDNTDDAELKAALQHIQDYCRQCQFHQAPPKRFRFRLPPDVDPTFNGIVILDIAYMETGADGVKRKPFLHIIDEATGFSAARWLRSMSAEHVWDMFRESWVDVYQGPPEIVKQAQGKNFVGAKFTDQANLLGTTTKPVPTEAHYEIGKVERAHSMLKRSYDCIKKEIPDADPTLTLQMAVKACNDTAGPDGLVPTLLVFGAYYRMSAVSAPTSSMTKRAKAIQVAMKELARVQAERNVRNALATRNGPDPEIPAIGTDVLTYRENAGNGAAGWCGPFKVMSVDVTRARDKPTATMPT